MAQHASAERPLKVKQFHYTCWPDHGVPEYATSMLSFHKRVISQHKTNRGPILVHCRYMLTSLECLASCSCKYITVVQCWSWTYWYLHLHRQCPGPDQEGGGGGHCRSHQQDEAPAHEDGADSCKLCWN